MPSFLVATDSFKGSLAAETATRAIARGLRRGMPGAQTLECPLSDGGEGFVDGLVRAGVAQRESATTTDALGRPIDATYGVLEGGETVAIELASAAGWAQLAAHERDPELTSTHGVGQLIAEAYRRHRYRRLVLALGGSATVDGGAGLLIALGARFLDTDDCPIPNGGGGLARLARIDLAGLSPALREATIELAVDVTNPLLGPRGAAAVFGPQKGARPAAVLRLEAGLTRLAEAIAEATGLRVHDLPGGGAAGGVPAGLVGLIGATLGSGFDRVATLVALDARLVEADWVVTGEGQLDATSFDGKVVGELARRCQVAGRPLVAIVGRIDAAGEALLSAHEGVAFSLTDGPLGPTVAVADAELLLERAAERVARLLAMGPTKRALGKPGFTRP